MTHVLSGRVGCDTAVGALILPGHLQKLQHPVRKGNEPVCVQGQKNGGEVAEERVRERGGERERETNKWVNGLVPCSMKKHPADPLSRDPAESSRGSIPLCSGESLLCTTAVRRGRNYKSCNSKSDSKVRIILVSLTKSLWDFFYCIIAEWALWQTKTWYHFFDFCRNDAITSSKKAKVGL